ncbi:hypothetical protein CDAR_100931 [Caerostris darwini]|uniref:Uncharacterized protein n=1 Tax=Caerostris darwini TaxID=1538125 RepID=A0AAV4VW72_9ARAC|nr:hypothetical protein CDAR_100931 [Caerostris darwini]
MRQKPPSPSSSIFIVTESSVLVWSCQKPTLYFRQELFTITKLPLPNALLNEQQQQMLPKLPSIQIINSQQHLNTIVPQFRNNSLSQCDENPPPPNHPHSSPPNPVSSSGLATNPRSTFVKNCLPS